MLLLSCQRLLMSLGIQLLNEKIYFNQLWLGFTYKQKILLLEKNTKMFCELNCNSLKTYGMEKDVFKKCKFSPIMGKRCLQSAWTKRHVGPLWRHNLTSFWCIHPSTRSANYAISFLHSAHHYFENWIYFIICLQYYASSWTT